MTTLLHPARRRLGDLLLAKGYLRPEQLEAALALQKELHGEKLLGEVVVEQDFCTEDQVLECVAAEYGVPYAKLDARLFDPAVVESIPRDWIEKHNVLPLFKVRDSLTVAVSEPSNVFLLERIKDLAGCNVQIVVAAARDIRRMQQTYLPNSTVFVIDDIIDDAGDANVTLIEQTLDDIGDLEEVAGQSPVIRLVNYIIYHAVKQGASDIHIEPTDNLLRVRYRIDGALHKALEPPRHLGPAVTSRIKIMANLDISERRLPQDGRIHVLMESRPIDLRVSTFPAANGEKTVIRVLDNRNVLVNLESLGFSAENLAGFQEQIHRPNGIVLVTGPTGSGKSTTLYAALHAVSSMEKNVCTVEDPVEFHLPLVNQFQVRDKIGLTFAAALRSLLRQDPDVIMVGEIRDEETARVATQAALTGHLVFSTLHTNDATSAITRLVNMGVEPYLIGASLNAVLAQRLVRRICSRCRQETEPTRVLRLAVKRAGFEIDRFYRGAGCSKCRNAGYSGRIAIHELLVLDDPLRDLIAARAPLAEVRQYARQHGVASLRADGLRKVKEGITTLEEVFQASDET